MLWDRVKAVDYFMNQYNRYDPGHYQFRHNEQQLTGVYDTELALQKVYMECAAAAVEKQALLTKLNQLIKYGAEDSRAHRPAKFKSIVKFEAAEIKHQLETGKLGF